MVGRAPPAGGRLRCRCPRWTTRTARDEHKAPDLTDFIADLPKVELHVHHVGSATPQTAARLAERHAGDTPVPADPALLTEYFTFTDFAHFIEVYVSVVDLVRDAEDVATLTYDIGAGLAAQSVRYAELTLSPYSSIVRGIPAEAYCEAVEDARRRAARDHGIELRWCFDISGPPWMPAADVTLDVALRLPPGRADQLRVGRSGDRGVPAAVRRPLRRRQGGRAA